MWSCYVSKHYRLINFKIQFWKNEWISEILEVSKNKIKQINLIDYNKWWNFLEGNHMNVMVTPHQLYFHNTFLYIYSWRSPILYSLLWPILWWISQIWILWILYILYRVTSVFSKVTNVLYKVISILKSYWH